MSELTQLLERAQQGDAEACETALEENRALIWSVVRRYRGCGADAEDLYQLGCIGFIKAVRSFDLTYGTQFSTYAVPKIAGEIRRYLRDDQAVKVGRTAKERSFTLRRLRQALASRLGREARLSELAEEAGMTAEEIAAIDAATAPPDSLQRELAEGLTLESVLTEGAPEDELVEKLALREALNGLPERERMVIELRYFHDLTQTQTAKVIGVSQVQVSRLERRGVELLRGALS